MDRFLVPEIHIYLGPGGVGKTTLSILRATQSFLEGKKVAILSIDPSKRLAGALGIQNSSQLKTVYEDKKSGGLMQACVIDQKEIFEDIVRQAVSSDKKVRTILEHPIYRAASEHMGGATEYLALYRLKEILEAGEHDLVVLDSPPDQHALDFFCKPGLLEGFQQEKVIQWLVKPIVYGSKLGLKSLLRFGGSVVSGLSKVAGTTTIIQLAEFVYLLQDVVDVFSSTGDFLTPLFSQDLTTVYIVTSADETQKALRLEKEYLKIFDKKPRWIVNKVLPPTITHELVTLDFPDLKAWNALKSKAVQQKENIQQLTERSLEMVPLQEDFLSSSNALNKKTWLERARS